MRLFFLVLFLGMGYFAQAQLHGIVVDASTQLPLSHVHVEVHELNTEVITDGKGYFIVEEIPVGKYHFKAASGIIINFLVSKKSFITSFGGIDSHCHCTNSITLLR